ncbi:MAG: hypothetical protein JXA30_07230 [Deltaproteobacteria bacterium]|nr:hypothetical protein [Deltaproteobacteria bacterium]
MTWAELHGESEKLAAEAQLAMRARNADKAIELYKRAADLEWRAYNSLDISKERTRGITAVSTVALWFKANEYTRAEQCAYSVLADSSMPAFARDDLRNLVQAIWTESSKQKAGVTFSPGHVLVSVRGGEVVTGGAPLDLIIDKVQAIQSLFYRTIEFLNSVAFRKRGRPSKELQESCRPWLFQSAPGSYQFSVAIERPKQLDLFRKEVEPEQVANRFLEIVRASSYQDSTQLERLVPDERYRDTFLKLTRNLAPTGKSFDRIEFRSSGETRPVALGVEARASINQQLRNKPRGVKTGDQNRVELKGTLRAVHLDKDWLEIVTDDVSTRIVGLQDTVDDVIGPMVNRLVLVRAYRVLKVYRFLDIELIE